MFSGIYLAIVFLFFKWRSLFPLMGLYFLPPLGKESIIPMGVGLGIHPATIAFSVAFIDIVVGLFIALNFDLFKKTPFLGGYVDMVERKGEKVLKTKGWLRKFTFYGLILVVMFPFQGSGAITASILGRLMGLKPIKVFLSITIGALIGCSLIAYSTDFVIYLTKLNVIAGLITIIVIIFVFYLTYKKFWKT